MLQVVIVGAGLGGLACAVACAKIGMKVMVLERADKFLPVGAGIVIPPNGERAMKYLDLVEKLRPKSVVLDSMMVRRYQDGSLLVQRKVGDEQEVERFKGHWWVTHREDYHKVLLDAAIEVGVEMKMAAWVREVDLDSGTVVLDSGENISGDIVIGADGLWSTTRKHILGRPTQPTETGDLAYRATFPIGKLRDLHDPDLDAILDAKASTLWWGGTGIAFSTLCEQGLNKAEGDIAEVKETFKGWDPKLTKMIGCISTVLKWKLCHHEELHSWCKNTTAVLGDACHPTLPYQAQGAAMAVEDGTVIGHLFGLLMRDFPEEVTRQKVPSILKLYETIRKPRTTLNVQGAIANRKMYHLPDGPEQRKRDDDIKTTDFISPSPWKFADGPYQMKLLGFDTIKDAGENYSVWLQGQKDQEISNSSHAA